MLLFVILALLTAKHFSVLTKNKNTVTLFVWSGPLSSLDAVASIQQLSGPLPEEPCPDQTGPALRRLTHAKCREGTQQPVSHQIMSTEKKIKSDIGSRREGFWTLHIDECASVKGVDVWEGQARGAVLSSLQLVGGGGGVVVSERHRVLVQTVSVYLQGWLLIVGKNHGEKGLGVADKLVHIPFTSHLRKDK